MIPTDAQTPFSVKGLEDKPRSVTVDPEHVILLKARKASAQ